MTLATALYNHLTGDASLVALVGDHIWHLLAGIDLGDDAGEYYPCVIFSGDTEPHLAFRATSHYTDTIRIACMSTTSDVEAQSIADAVQARLHLFSGTMGGAGGVTVLHARLLRSEPEIDPESNVFTVAQSYRIDRAA
jgi:hypothetical protein